MLHHENDRLFALRGFAIDANNAGVALARQGNTDAAIGQFRAAIAKLPDFAEAHLNLGIALERMRDWGEAERSYQRALAIEPLNPAAHFNLGIVLEKQGRTVAAVRRYRLVLECRADFPEAHFRLGMALSKLDAWPEAEAVLRQAVQGDPKSVAALYRWQIALQKTEQLCLAETACRRALWLEDAGSRGVNHLPARWRARLLNGLANVLLGLGRAEEAIECFRLGVAANPAAAGIHSNLIYAMHYSPGVTSGQIHAESVEWAVRHGAIQDAEVNLEPAHRAVAAVDSPGRMRIGYVTPDLRRHPTRFFFEPVLDHHDRSRFEIFVYADFAGGDRIPETWLARAEHWRAIGGRNDAEVTEIVRRDGIDLLVDLSGHSGRHRLGVFARKPAAAQAAWMGYPSTTGLPQVDWRITDAIVDPPGCEIYYTERLVRLPRTYQCYKPSDNSPLVGDLPALANGYVTFGCLNNPCKITPAVIQTWAKVLDAVPRSRLHVLFNGGGPEKAALRQRFAALGIGPEQLVPHARVPSRRRYLELYRNIDIGLDPFPYNGCTTSCDALWMGVPVVTLSGDTTVSRVGKMLLEELGLGMLEAAGHEQYVQIACELATKLTSLEGLRRTLRAGMEASPRCDGPGFTRELESVYEKKGGNQARAQPFESLGGGIEIDFGRRGSIPLH